MLRIFIVIIFLITNSATIQAGTYYFSSSKGDDKRSIKEAQNPETAWRTIQKLNSLLNIIRPGDSILFKSGEQFHGTIIITKSGTLKSPIYFGNYGLGENPTLTGLREITNWSSKGKNLFESQIQELDSSLSVVTFNNKLYPQGRYPNANEYNGGYFTINHYKNGHIESLNFKTNINYSGAEVVIRKNNWIIDRHIISSTSNNSVNYKDFEKEIAPMVGYGFFIQNHPSTLNQHGEWYFDRNSKKLLIYHQGVPTDDDIKASTLSEVLIFQNTANYIIFENINIEGSNKDLITLKGSSNIVFNNCNLAQIGQNAIYTVMANNIEFSNSSIKYSLNGGFFLGYDDSDIVIKNSEFENIFNFAGMGKNGEMQSQAIYMSEKTSNVTIENSKFINCGYNAINFSGNNIIIRNNLIDTFCFVKDDGAGIYTFTGSAKTAFTNRKIIGNIITNGLGAVSGTKPYGFTDLPYVEGIYLDTFVNEVNIDNNTIANIKGKGIFLNNSKNINIRNNKIINTGYAIYLKSDDMEDYSKGIVLNKNEFFSISESQLYYYITANSNELSKIGEFYDNIFFNPFKNPKPIFLNINNTNEFIEFSTWKTSFGLDKSSKLSQVENLISDFSQIKNSKSQFPILFEYNHSKITKSISLFGTYIDINGNKFTEKIDIPPYSSIVLLKAKSDQ